MKVKILSHTPNPELVVASAAKLCYSPVGVEEIQEKLTEENIEKFVSMLASIGHHSPLEHCTFTFAIEGISRACSHQLVRHRIASYSQQSQRYVNLDKTFDFIYPNAILEEGLSSEYGELMDYIHTKYVELSNKLEEKYLAKGMNKREANKKAIEDARYVLPNACETKIVFTMNVRTLLHFFEKRCCSRAQWEIRNLANEMLRQCKEISPILFSSAGATCKKGYCTEGKMSCNPKYR